jgi:osmoprotectant transport system substrate-binding protein
MRTKFVAAGAVVLALAIVVSACSSSKSKSSGSSSSSTTGAAAGAGSVVVGSADFPESVLLADIYADALSARGVSVTKKLNIGERSVYLKALQDGSISFFPEYNGSILYALDTKATAKSTAEVDAALPAALGAKLTALNSAPAQDSDTITVSSKVASKYNLKTIADLAPVASKLTLGAPAGFKTRADGVPSLKSVYGVVFGHFTATSAGGTFTVTALKNGSIDAADIFSTDGSIAANHFVVLQDPKNMFAAQNITPIVATASNTSTITAAANAVSAKLDTTTLAQLDAEVAGGKSADDVAKAWLTSVGLS